MNASQAPAHAKSNSYVLLVALDTSSGQVVGITKNRGPQQNIGKISFPGGKVESGESRKMAAAREMKEETGVSTIAEDWELCFEFEAFNPRSEAYDFVSVLCTDTPKSLHAKTMEDEPVWVMDINWHLKNQQNQPQAYNSRFYDILTRALQVTKRVQGQAS